MIDHEMAAIAIALTIRSKTSLGFAAIAIFSFIMIVLKGDASPMSSKIGVEHTVPIV